MIFLDQIKQCSNELDQIDDEVGFGTQEARILGLQVTQSFRERIIKLRQAPNFESMFSDRGDIQSNMSKSNRS